MLGRYITRAVDAQARWSKPLGEFNQRWLTALFRPIRPVKDFLNGTWLGHPVHAVITDVPIGALTVSIVADLIGQPVVADVAMLLGVLAMVGSAVTGVADYADVDGTARNRATVHSVLMTSSLVLYALSLVIRSGQPADRIVPIVLAGDRLPGPRPRRGDRRGPRLPDRDPGQPARLARCGREMDRRRPRRPRRHPAGRARRSSRSASTSWPSSARASGSWPSTRRAPTPAARWPRAAVVGGAIECPWHGSRFQLADGHVVRGPAVYDQPAYDVRPAESGAGWEARRRPA